MMNRIIDEFDASALEKIKKPYYEQVDLDKLHFFSLHLENFQWNHHGNSEKDYENLVNGMHRIENLLDSGNSFSEITSNYPRLTPLIESCYGSNSIQVYKSQDGQYIFSGNDGRHRLLMAQKMGLPKLTLEVIGNYNTTISQQPLSTTFTQLTGAGLSGSQHNIQWLSNEINRSISCFDNEISSHLSYKNKISKIESIATYQFSDQTVCSEIIQLLQECESKLGESISLLGVSKEQLRRYIANIQS